MKIGVVTCATMLGAVTEWTEECSHDTKLYILPPVCLFNTKSELIRKNIDQALYENDFVILNNGECHKDSIRFRKYYDYRVRFIDAQNCFQMLLNDNLFNRYISKGVMMIPDKFLYKWRNQMDDRSSLRKQTSFVMGKLGCNNLCFKEMVFIETMSDRPRLLSVIEDFLQDVSEQAGVLPKYQIVKGRQDIIKNRLDLAIKSFDAINSKMEHSGKTTENHSILYLENNPNSFYYVMNPKNGEVTQRKSSLNDDLNELSVHLIRSLSFKEKTPDNSIKIDNLQDSLIDRGNAFKALCSSKSRETKRIEYRIFYKEKLRYIREELFSIFRNGEKPKAIQGSLTDITNQKSLENTVLSLYRKEASLRKKLEHQISMRDKYANSLVHDIKTPLTPILTASDALISLLTNKENRHVNELAKVIRSGALALDERMNEFLEVIRGETKSLRLNLDDVSINYFIDNLVQSYKDVYINEGKTIKFKSDLLDSERGIFDKAKVKRIISNLLDNSLKFINKGDYVLVSVSNDSNNIIMSVEDNGPGVCADIESNLFEPYKQYANSPQLSGIGLGLYLCKMYAKLHGGGIHHHRILPHGAKFTFYIPLNSEVGSIKGCNK